MADWTWTDARVERLKQLWRDGETASEIMAALNVKREPGELACSRSSILGKANRLKLAPRRDRSLAARIVQRPTPAPKKPDVRTLIKHGMADKPRITNPHDLKAKAELRQSEPGLPEKYTTTPTGEGVKLVDLTDRNCHWPLGDPRDHDFEFCGKRAAVKLVFRGSEEYEPYCAHHCRLAYQPRESRRRITLPYGVGR